MPLHAGYRVGYAWLLDPTARTLEAFLALALDLTNLWT